MMGAKIFPLCHHYITGIDKWFQLTPIHKDDEVQGEILVEASIDTYSEVNASFLPP